MSDKLERDVFGQTKAGETVYRVVIKGGGLTAKIISWAGSSRICVSRDMTRRCSSALTISTATPSIRPISARHPAAVPTVSAVAGLRLTTRTISSN